MEKIILILEIIGTCAFAVSGAAVAINKHFDIFGVLFCSVITALGGGVMRDILLSSLPPAMFYNYIYVIFAAAASMLTFIIAMLLKSTFSRHLYIIDRVNNIFDAVGLGVFTVVGINTAVMAGYGDNPFFTVFLGMITGCGGGIIRDVTVREVPLVFSKRVYAVASIAGGILHYVLSLKFDINSMLSAVAAIFLIFMIRVFASVFKWDLPKAY